MIALEVTIPGEPTGKGRPIFARRGAHVTTRTPPSTARWEQFAAAAFDEAWRHAPPVFRDEAVTVEIVALMPRTKAQQPRARRRVPVPEGRLVHTGKPDVDNIGKIVLDALVLAGVLEDDTSVTRLVVERWRVAADEVPGVRVRVIRHGQPE